MSRLTPDINMSPGYNIGSWLRRNLLSPTLGYGVNVLNSNLPNRLLHGALAGGISAIGANALSSAFRRDGSPFSWWQAGLLGAGIGAGAAGGLGHGFQKGQQYYKSAASKKAFFLPGNKGEGVQRNLSYVLGRLNSDTSVDPANKMQLISLVETLPSQDLSKLAGILRMVGGATAGFVIAKYLLGANIGGSMITSLIGGLAAKPGPQKNAFGQTFF
jgi:hypothetical protein